MVQNYEFFGDKAPLKDSGDENIMFLSFFLTKIWRFQKKALTLHSLSGSKLPTSRSRAQEASHVRFFPPRVKQEEPDSMAGVFFRHIPTQACTSGSKASR